MGAALYIVLEQEISGLDATIDGKALSRAEDKLALATRRLGVRPLMEFFSVSPEELSDLMDGEEIDVEIPAEQWFSPEEGLKTVEALLGEVNAKPELSDVKTDLQGFERVLREAVKHSVKWHLAIDY